jgi:FixJ family two-component response regulator
VKKLIIVDDESSLLTTYERILRATLETIGVEVKLCSNADEALEEIEKRGEPGLIMTDDRMPGMSGRQLASELRRRGYRGTIVMCSGTADQEVLGQGVDILLEKPVDNAVLRNTIRAHLA